MSSTPEIQAAHDTVYENILGAESILVALRMRQGLDNERFQRLTAAIQLLIEHYRDQREVPKRLALAFVDISNYFFYKDGVYPPGALEQIEDAGIELTQLASQLFDD